MNRCVVCLYSNKAVVCSAGGAVVSRPLPFEWLESTDKGCMNLCAERIKAALSWAGFDPKRQRVVCTQLPQEIVRETIWESMPPCSEPRSKPWLQSFSSRSATGQTYRFECYRQQIRRIRNILRRAGIANPEFQSRALAASASTTDEPCAVIYPENSSLIKVVLVQHQTPRALYILPSQSIDSLNDVLSRMEKHIGTAVSVGICGYVDPISFTEQVSTALAGCGRNTIVLPITYNMPPRVSARFGSLCAFHAAIDRAVRLLCSAVGFAERLKSSPETARPSLADRHR